MTTPLNPPKHPLSGLWLALVTGTCFTLIGLGAIAWQIRPFATVGSSTLSRQAFETARDRELRRNTEHALEGLPGELEQRVARDLVDREVMLQVAIARKIQVPEELIEHRIGLVMAQFPDVATARRSLKDAGTSPEDLRRKVARDLLVERLQDDAVRREAPDLGVLRSHYETQKRRFFHPERVHARHILLPRGPAGHRLALEVVGDLRQGVPFEPLARQHSLDVTTQDSGGDLGYFERGRMLPAFEQAAFGARVGRIVGPIETRFGYHVIEVLDHERARTDSFEAILPRLRSELGAEARHRALERAMETWRQEVPIAMGPGYAHLDPRLEGRP